jgi:hypothetical protein
MCRMLRWARVKWMICLATLGAFALRGAIGNDGAPLWFALLAATAMASGMAAAAYFGFRWDPNTVRPKGDDYGVSLASASRARAV